MLHLLHPTATEPSSRRTRPWLPAAIGAALSLLVYCITIHGVYIYDDVQIISLDKRVKSPALWGQFWTRAYNDGADNLYRPLVSQSFGFEWWLHGDRPWAFHLVNLVIGAAVTAMVAELARRLVSWRVGLFAGLLFAAHPIHSEVTAGVAGRAELACAAGILGAMILFLGHPMTFRRAWAIAGLSLVAMLSKEQGLLTPLLLAILIPIRRNQNNLSQPDPAERHPMQLLVGLLIWSLAGLIILREEILGLHFAWDRNLLDFTIQPMIRCTGSDRWLMPLVLIGHYAQLLIAPIHLSIDYGYATLGWIVDRSDPYLYIGVAAVIAWIIATWASFARGARIVIFCLLAFAISYSMSSNIILIGTDLAERLMFIPSIFFIILIAIGLARLPNRLAGTLVVILLALGSLRTFTYIQRWNDKASFYAYELKQQPLSIRLHLLLGFDDFEHDRLDEARALLADARNIAPDYAQAWQLSGQIEEKAQNWKVALAFYKTAHHLAPSTAMERKIANANLMLLANPHSP
jgi:hypothetical protein